MVNEMELAKAKQIRHDMIGSLESLIDAATTVKARLEQAQKNDDYSAGAKTDDIVYGSIGMSTSYLLKNEAIYNTLIDSIVMNKALEGRK